MAFLPRQFGEILDDMISFVRSNTDVTDFEVGSVVRTILEAAAIEDDEQYFQMAKLLDAFRDKTATGEDLEERAADFDLTRLQPQVSTGNVIIQDGLLTTEFLAFDVSATDTSVPVNDSSGFPTSGFPYTIRIGEGTILVEDVTVTANSTVTNTFTTSALVNDHNIGDRVSLVTGVADVALSSGIQVQQPAIGDEPPVTFTTIESGVIVNGNFSSTPIRAQSVNPGTDGNVGASQVTQFTGAPPFDSATVTNTTAFSGGRDIETDAELRDRLALKKQSLSAGTPLALKEAVLGLTDPVTAQRVVTANVLEKFADDEVIVYIDDGTGFVPDQVVLARTAYAAGGPFAPGAGTIIADDVDDFPDEGFLILSPESSTQIEVVEYDSITRGAKTFNLVGTTANTHDSTDEIALVDVISASTEAGVDFYNTANFPIVRSSQRVWIDTGAGYSLQILDTDYALNKGTGQLELITSVPAGSSIVANYTYYTGLIFEAQRVIDGDPNDEVTFPGVRAAGVPVVVEVPIIRRITVRLSITAQPGFTVENLTPLVQAAVETYISSLKIGDDVILSEIIERAMGVTGVFNVFVTIPTTDISVLENELPVPFSATGTSLVTVL